MTIIYKPSDIMKKFDLKESVYKKYIAALEKEGYIFQKNQQGHRIFTDQDIQTLDKFLELIRYDGMTIETVAKEIGKINSNDGITGENKKSYDVMAFAEKAVNAALEKQEQLLINKFNSLLEETKDQFLRIETREKERDKILMQSIRESQETKKILLEIKEQIAAANEGKKKWWEKIFRV